MKREDHDQRFKTLIKEFFPELMQLFYSPWEKYLVFEKPEWLMQEAFPEPPDGPRRSMDLVAKIGTRQPAPGYNLTESKEMLALIHIEIESGDSLGTLSQRMYEYNNALENEHKLPVMPIALLMNLAFDGLGVQSYVRDFFHFRKLRFDYFYIGLRGLDGVEYVQGENLLGVALSAQMRIPRNRVAWLGAEALRRFTEASVTEHQRYLLAEYVQAYLPMDEEQKQEFERILEAKPYAGVKAMNKTVFEQGIEKGIEKGIERGRQLGLELGLQEGRQAGRQEGQQEGRVIERRETLRLLLTDRFGSLSADVNARVEQFPYDELATLIRRVYRADSLKELGLED